MGSLSRAILRTILSYKRDRYVSTEGSLNKATIDSNSCGSLYTAFMIKATVLGVMSKGRYDC